MDFKALLCTFSEDVCKYKAIGDSSWKTTGTTHKYIYLATVIDIQGTIYLSAHGLDYDQHDNFGTGQRQHIYKLEPDMTWTLLVNKPGNIHQ